MGREFESEVFMLKVHWMSISSFFDWSIPTCFLSFQWSLLSAMSHVYVIVIGDLPFQKDASRGQSVPVSGGERTQHQ